MPAIAVTRPVGVGAWAIADGDAGGSCERLLGDPRIAVKRAVRYPEGVRPARPSVHSDERKSTNPSDWVRETRSQRLGPPVEVVERAL